MTITREFTKEQAQKIIDAADEVITALAGTNEDVHPDNSTKMCAAWDELNDHYAPPEVVRELARIALASLEAEPVGYMNRFTGRVFTLEEQPGAYTDVQVYVPIYTAPPTPVSVPTFDEWLEIRGNKPLGWVKDAMRESYDACRAAMQGKAEQPQNSQQNIPENIPANTPCKDAPEYIWLQTAGVWPENGEFSELTWCSDNQHEDDTLYIRADVVAGNYPVIPDGWVMVPVDPTVEMRSAGHEHFNAMIDACGDFTPTGMYKAMLAAAPQQEAE